MRVEGEEVCCVGRVCDPHGEVLVHRLRGGFGGETNEELAEQRVGGGEGGDVMVVLEFRVKGWVVSCDAGSGTKDGFELSYHYLDANAGALHASGGGQVKKGSICSDVAKTELDFHVGGVEGTLDHVDVSHIGKGDPGAWRCL